MTQILTCFELNLAAVACSSWQIPAVVQLHKMHVDIIARREWAQSSLNVASLPPTDSLVSAAHCTNTAPLN